MDNTTLTKDHHPGGWLSFTQRAMVRIISLAMHPRALSQLAELMDDNDSIVIAAFLLYAEAIDFTGPSLKKQFDGLLVGVFDDWECCRWFLVEHVLGWNGWIRELRQEKGQPFDDLLTWNDEALRNHLAVLNLQLIDTGESLVLLRRRSEDQ